MPLRDNQDDLTSPTIGGHAGRTWVDEGALLYMRDTYGVKTMLDIGCGPGGMKEVADKLGVEYLGIDGDPALDLSQLGFMRHDFYSPKKISLPKAYDLCWCIEFLEHILPEHLENVFDAMRTCRYVVCTASVTPRPHHVNLQPRKYWIEQFSKAGFIYDSAATTELMLQSTMKAKPKCLPFIIETGMFFRRIL
jgi:SAM-dependent methyltransferase